MCTERAAHTVLGMGLPRTLTRRRTGPGLSAALCALLALAGVMLGASASNAAAAPDAAPAPRAPATAALWADVRLGRSGRKLPASFSGLSIEANELHGFLHAGALFHRVISLIRPSDGQPLLLRIGGRSADDTYWKTPTSGAPSWVFELGDQWLADLAALTRRDRLRVILTVNLAVHSPTMATAFALAAARALPRHTLAGAAIGNEPDLYPLQPGLERERITDRPLAPAHWTQQYAPSDYRREYIAYARALSAALPETPLLAPDSASSSPRWLRAVSGLGRLAPGSITVHAYGATTCTRRNSLYYPTAASLLREKASRGLAQRLRHRLRIAGWPDRMLRVSEFNSISCGGDRGVADSFATALWALDTLFETADAGATGVNWHIRPHTPNAPFQLASRGLIARPELYALALFAQMARPTARLVTTRLNHASGLHLKAWALRYHAGLSVLLINKGAGPVHVRLHTGSRHTPAHIQQLRAPSLTSRTGITLAGQAIGADGRWHGHHNIRSASPTNGTYHIAVPGYSAALINLRS